jgi:hypothetical protein
MAKGHIRVDIERLVTWALRDQGLGWSGKDSFDAASQLALLGTMVDTSSTGSHPSIGLWTSDDAMLVKQAIEALPRDAAALVVRYGRTALRPEWGQEGVGQWEQEVDGAGRLRWEWDDPVNRKGNRRPRMVFVGEDPEIVEAERAEYDLWWLSLRALVEPLNRQLGEHVATGPAVSRAPWLDAKPVVHGVEEVERPRKVRDEPAAVKRERAQDRVSARASDWSAPPVIHKQDSRRKRGARGGA